MVHLDFDLSKRTNDNFAGQNPVAEASGDPQNIRITDSAVFGGKSVDVVLDSPDGALSICSNSVNCDVTINSYGVLEFKVQNGITKAYKVRWTFEYSDGSGAATLPKVCRCPRAALAVVCILEPARHVRRRWRSRGWTWASPNLFPSRRALTTHTKLGVASAPQPRIGRSLELLHGPHSSKQTMVEGPSLTSRTRWPCRQRSKRAHCK